VSVNVKGETTMVGSLIANIDTNGIDQGNLVLNTAKLNAFDLVNTDDNWHIAIGTSFAGDDGKAVNGSQQSGTWKHTATGAVGYQDVDGVTRATVGAGAIVVGSGDLRTLNRDVTKVNEITKMESSQGEITVPVPASVAEPVRDGTVLVATVAGKTVYYVSPVYASRVINENNDQTGKAPNPAPHFIPGLGLTESETGKDYSFNEVTETFDIPEFPKSLASGTKANPILKGMYHTIPGFPSNSGFHDAGMEWMGDPNGFVKAVTIPPYFAYNYYGAVGTLMDVPNYNTNFTGIRNSVIGNTNVTPQK
jgi:hypothetical protein